MWPESSNENNVNLVKKICYNSRDIEFFLEDYFFGAPCKLYSVYGLYTRCDVNGYIMHRLAHRKQHKS